MAAESGQPGQAFAGLPENARTHYVTGLVDGIFVAVLFGASQGRVKLIMNEVRRPGLVRSGG
jgi:hypothetical protein